MHRVTKTYGHNLGLSVCFRQHAATSHCKFLHGYALEIKLTFAAPELNENNWVIDYGSLKPVKKWLEENFDHKTLIAEDDPSLKLFQDMNEEKSIGGKLIDMIVVPFVGCEGFAQHIYANAHFTLVNAAKEGTLQGGAENGVFLESVEVREHPANSAIYTPNHIVDLRGRPVNYVR